MGEVVRPNGGRRSDAGRESSLWAGGRVAGTAGSVVHGRLERPDAPVAGGGRRTGAGAEIDSALEHHRCSVSISGFPGEGCSTRAPRVRRTGAGRGLPDYTP